MRTIPVRWLPMEICRVGLRGNIGGGILAADRLDLMDTPDLTDIELVPAPVLWGE